MSDGAGGTKSSSADATLQGASRDGIAASTAALNSLGGGAGNGTGTAGKERLCMQHMECNRSCAIRMHSNLGYYIGLNIGSVLERQIGLHDISSPTH